MPFAVRHARISHQRSCIACQRSVIARRVTIYQPTDFDHNKTTSRPYIKFVMHPKTDGMGTGQTKVRQQPLELLTPDQIAKLVNIMMATAHNSLWGFDHHGFMEFQHDWCDTITQGTSSTWRDLMAIFLIHSIFPAVHITDMAYIPSIFVQQDPAQIIDDPRVLSYTRFTGGDLYIVGSSVARFKTLFGAIKSIFPDRKLYAGMIIGEETDLDSMHVIPYIIDVEHRSFEIFNPNGYLDDGDWDPVLAMCKVIQSVTGYKPVTFRDVGCSILPWAVQLRGTCGLWALFYFWLRASNSALSVQDMLVRIALHDKEYMADDLIPNDTEYRDQRPLTILSHTNDRLNKAMRVLFHMCATEHMQKEHYQSLFNIEVKSDDLLVHTDEMKDMLMDILNVIAGCQHPDNILEEIRKHTRTSLYPLYRYHLRFLGQRRHVIPERRPLGPYHPPIKEQPPLWSQPGGLGITSE